jgi:hypothetical protein
MGISGPRPSHFDLQFVEWCEARRMLCVRTVDLFWAFEYHRKGFPRKVSVPRLRARWNDERARRRLVAAGLLKNKGNDRKILVLPKTTPRHVALERLSPEDREYLDDETPDPGTWQQYSRGRIAYFEVERRRYEQVLQFWRSDRNIDKHSLRAPATATAERKRIRIISSPAHGSSSSRSWK